jgi:hypothetical protein
MKTTTLIKSFAAAFLFSITMLTVNTAKAQSGACDYDGNGQVDTTYGATYSDGPITIWFSGHADTAKITSTSTYNIVVLTLSDSTVLTYARQNVKSGTYVVPSAFAGLQIFNVRVFIGSTCYYVSNYTAMDTNGTCQDTGGFPFPVKMVSFEAKKINDNQVQLNWRTSSEENNDHISIEKTYDNQNWEEVCRVPGHGTTQTPHNYSCTDNNASEGGHAVAYYRPKQVDYNGAYAYFNTIKIRLVNAASTASVQGVYPNPATDRLYIQYNSSDNDVFTIRLLSLDGKELKNQQYVAKEGQQTIDLDIAEQDLKSGFYILQVENNGQVYTNKIYKQ